MRATRSDETARPRFASVGRILMGIGCLFILAAIIIETSSKAGEPSNHTSWPRPIMGQVFESMSYLLPRTIDRERFASEDERAGIQAQLDALAESAVHLETREIERGSSLSFLSHSLAGNVEQARMRFIDGRHEEARYFLLGSLQNCFACHSRRASNLRFENAQQLTSQLRPEDLSHSQRALLFVVTRRFDEAIATWEEMLVDPKIAPGDLKADGVLSDYLAVAVRGLEAYAPTRASLELLRQRPDIPLSMRPVVDSWIEALRTLEVQANRDVSLDRARALVAAANEVNQWTGDRRGLVYDLAASNLLNQLTDRLPESPNAIGTPELSEAYYLLGLIESRSMATFWIDEAHNYLEAAVRLQPTSKVAQQAFALFEQNMITDYGGASSLELPVDIWVRLDSLRKMIDEQEKK